jgi:MoaA/NifB/PqqE/SkfB family radical SAM enzyme
LLNTGLRYITFSLDGQDAAIHDRHRGIPGLHQVVTEVIRRIKCDRPGMCVSLICIVMRETAAQLAEYAQWAEELGVDRVFFQPLADSPGRPETTADWHQESNLFVRDIEPLEHSIQTLQQWGRRSEHVEVQLRALRDMPQYFGQPESFQIHRGRCMLGQTDLQIDPSGILYMCDVRHTAFGHVDDGPLRQTWRSERARSVRRAIRECRRPCASPCQRSPGLLEKAATFLRYARMGRP